jgi:hypothetical protein
MKTWATLKLSSKAHWKWHWYGKPLNKNVVEGIVSQDFVVCFLASFDWYKVPTHQELVHLLLKIVFVSKFLIFASQRSELTQWVELSFCHTVVPYWEPTMELMEMLFFFEKILKMETVPVWGSLLPRRTSGAFINFLCKTNRKISCLWALDWD